MAARSAAFVVALLGVASLQGCGGYTEEAYCKEKVQVECENFDRLFAKHEAENKEGLGIMLHKASHLRFYKQCKDKEQKGWEELETQCKKLKDSDLTLADGTKCKPAVGKAVEKHHDMVLGRTVLGCIEKGLEAAGKEEFDHELKPKKAAPKHKATPHKSKEYFCDCRGDNKGVDGCEDETYKPLPTDPEVESESAAAELCKKHELELLAWECKGAERCKALDKGLFGPEASAKEACKAQSNGTDTCDLGGSADDAPVENAVSELPANYGCRGGDEGEDVIELTGDELLKVYTEHEYKGRPGDLPKPVVQGLQELCKSKGGEFKEDLEEDLLQISAKVKDQARARPPAPRRKRGEPMVLAQESTRVEVDSSGVAKVRSFEPRASAGAEVKPSGGSHLVNE